MGISKGGPNLLCGLGTAGEKSGGREGAEICTEENMYHKQKYVQMHYSLDKSQKTHDFRCLYRFSRSGTVQISPKLGRGESQDHTISLVPPEGHQATGWLTPLVELSGTFWFW